MHVHHIFAHPAVKVLFQVEFEVDAHDSLHGEHHHEGEGEGGVDIGRKLPAFVGVSEEVTDYREDDAESLEGDVKTGAGYLVG